VKALIGIFFNALLFSLVFSSVGQTEVVKVACDVIKGTQNIDGFQKAEFVIDTDTSEAKLACSEKIENNLCSNIQWSQSTVLSPTERRICSNGESIVAFGFRLTHEDSKDELVTFDFYRSCITGQLRAPKNILAMVFRYYSHDNKIISQKLVNCSTSAL
jgi:hypothetical protein